MQLWYPNIPPAQLSAVFDIFTLECTLILHPLFTPQVFSTTENYSCSFIGEVRYCVAVTEVLFFFQYTSTGINHEPYFNFPIA